MKNIAVIILAAGKATRFGGGKLTALYRGSPLLTHTFRAIPQDAVNELLAVVSDPVTEACCKAIGLPYVSYPGGPLSESIRTGLTALHRTPDGVMFVNADQPFLKPDTLRRMITDFSSRPDSIVRLCSEGTPGSPVLFPRTAIPLLLALSGEEGGRSVLKSGRFPLHFTEAASSRELLDIDTPEILKIISEGDA